MADISDVASAAEPLIFLVDGAGGSYAIPRSVAEAHRASDALVTAVQELAAEQVDGTAEVTGYALVPRALVSITVGGVVLLVAAAGLAHGPHGLLPAATSSQQASSVGYELGSQAATAGRGGNTLSATGGRSANTFSASGGGVQGSSSTGGGANGYSSTGGGRNAMPPSGGGGNGMTATGGRGDGMAPSGGGDQSVPSAS